MSGGSSPTGSPAGPEVARPHLVIKRGHRGRYRFVLIGDGERIGGEVRIDATGGGQDGGRTVAIARITRLADALLAAVRPIAGRLPSADDVEETIEGDASDRRVPTKLDQGVRRG